MANKGIDFVLALNATKFQSGLRAITSQTKEAGSALQSYWKKSETGAGAAESSVSRLSSKLSGIKTALAGALVGGGVAYYANQVRKIADEYTNLNARIKLVTGSAEEEARVRERLFKISQETGTEYAGNANAYAKLARSMKDLGAESEEILDVTELVSKALIINGSSTEEAGSFMLQFAQAMGSGVLQGDELRAMLESNSLFAGELAKALGTNIAGLRQMGSDGALTTAKLREAFPKMTKVIEAEFAKLPVTTARAMTALDNVWKRIIDDSNKASDGTKGISKSITDFAETLDQNRNGIVSFFSFIIDMVSGATDKVSKLTQGISSIGVELQILANVAKGRIDFFDYAKMDVKEMNDWLKKNIQTMGEMSGAAKKAGNDVSSAAKLSAAVQQGATGSALKEMAKGYKQYGDEAKRIQGELGSVTRSLSEELREMARSGMSDLGSWRDRRKEAGEFAVAARRAADAGKAAFKAGNSEAGKDSFKVAAEYADKAVAAYRSLNETVKSGDQVVIGQSEALKVAMTGMQNAGKLRADILQQQAQAVEQAKKTLNEQSGGQLDESVKKSEEELQKVPQEIFKVGNTWTNVVEKIKNEPVKPIIEIEQEAYQRSIELLRVRIENQAKSAEEVNEKAARGASVSWTGAADNFESSWSKAISSVEGKLSRLAAAVQSSGFSGHGASGSYSRGGEIGAYKIGGLIQALSSGGGVRRMLDGGAFPGFGGGDRRLVLAEDGEVMINKYAVRSAGLKAALAFNSGRWDIVMAELSKKVKERIGFNLGGMVGSMPSPPQRLAAGGVVGGSGSGDTMTIKLDFGPGRSVPVQASRTDAARIKKEFARMDRMRSA